MRPIKATINLMCRTIDVSIPNNGTRSYVMNLREKARFVKFLSKFKNIKPIKVVVNLFQNRLEIDHPESGMKFYSMTVKQRLEFRKFLTKVVDRNINQANKVDTRFLANKQIMKGIEEL